MSHMVRIFYSYAHEDRVLRDQLEKHLAVLQGEGLVESWNDRQILPGSDWDSAINERVRQADIILLLISVDFLASAYITGVELRCALERAARQEAVVIPILLRPVDWQDSPLRALQALPSGARPVVKWRNRDEAFVDIADGIRRVVRGLRGSEAQSSMPGPILPDTAVQGRVLDAAMAAKVSMGKPADLVAMVRRVDSPGLKAVLEIDEEYSARVEDVRSKPFKMEFPRDYAGRPTPAAITLKVEGPDFDPPSQTKKVLVPPDGDSDVCTFFVTPLFAGELVLNLEVYAGEGQQLSRMFRVLSETSDRIVVRGRRLVSVPISTVASRPLLQPEREANAAAAPIASPMATAEPTTATGLPATLAPAASRAARSKLRYSRHLPAAAAVVLLCGSMAYYLRNPAGQPAAMAIADAVSRPSPAQAVTSAASAPPSAGSQNQYERGVAALHAEQPAAAVKDLEEAAAKAPTDASTAAALAAARVQLSDQANTAEKPALLAQAQQDARRAVAIQPSARNYWIEGISLQRDGKLADAEAALNKAVQLDSSLADAWYALGVVQREANKVDEAAAALRKAVELDPRNSDARLLLGATLAREDPVAAKRHVDMVVNDKAVSGAKLDAARRLSRELAK